MYSPWNTCGVVCVILSLAVLIQYRRVTDTQTHDEGVYRASIALRVKCLFEQFTGEQNWTNFRLICTSAQALCPQNPMGAPPHFPVLASHSVLAARMSPQFYDEIYAYDGRQL